MNPKHTSTRRGGEMEKLGQRGEKRQKCGRVKLGRTGKKNRKRFKKKGFAE